MVMGEGGEEYTVEEIQIHYEQISIREMEKLKRDSIAQFNATRGTGKGFEKYIRAIDQAISKARPPSKAEIAAKMVDFCNKLMAMGARRK